MANVKMGRNTKKEILKKIEMYIKEGIIGIKAKIKTGVNQNRIGIKTGTRIGTRIGTEITIGTKNQIETGVGKRNAIGIGETGTNLTETGPKIETEIGNGTKMR